MRIVALLALVFAAPATAHDFWVQPASYTVAVGAPLPVTIQVGHAADRERWGARLERITRFDAVGPDGGNRRADLRPGDEAQDALLRFGRPGAHVIVLATNHATSDLPADRFNAFLEEEGLTPAIRHRARLGLTGTPGRELYSRRAKALVRVGKSAGPAARAITAPVGLTLEIVPQADPQTLPPGARLPVLVLYEGRPLAGALVKLTNLDADAKPVAMQRTDTRGRTAFTLPRHGRWLLNTLWTKPLAGNPKADFETVFSSLTFGF